MQIVQVIFGIMLVLVLATGAWMVWSAHRGPRVRIGRGKSSRPTIDDEALAAKLAGSIWTRLAELKDSGIQLSLRSRLEATAGAPVAERLLVLQEVLLDLERLHPGRSLLSHSGSARSVGGTPSGEVLELLKLPPDQRSGFIGRAIIAGIEPLLTSCMGPRSAEAFFRGIGPLPGSVDEWSKWMEKGFLADLFARMLEWSKSGIGPAALLKILEQSASAVAAKFPLACFPAILATFPEGLLEREKIACAARETLWQELSAEAADDATSFGGYVLQHLIAEGGMGQVFLAEKKGAQEFRKVVVLKRMLPHLSQRPGFVAMFLEEARIVSMLAHPNIVQVFDFGEFNGAYYLAMEYLPGESLAVLIEEAERTGLRVPLQLALQVLISVCDGLHYVHEFAAGESPLHLIHRDVSPANIVVTYQGGVKLLDFGVARAVDRKDLTAPGLVKGKLAYCSPEQLGGAEMDRRSDIFSLGAVMFEILTGKQLFVRTTEMATCRAVAAGVVPLPSSLRPEVPPEVDRIVGKALRVSPDDRYQTAREMRGDLERLLTSPPERIDDYLVRLFGKDRMLQRTEVLSLRRRTRVTPWSATPSPLTSAAGALPLATGSTAPEPGRDSPQRGVGARVDRAPAQNPPPGRETTLSALQAERGMSSETWQRVKGIVENAFELEPAARAAFLNEACGSDSTLRDEVESLLRADAAASGYLEPFLASDVRVFPEPPGLPNLFQRLQTALGSAYAIERELAGGGISRIFVAEERALHRKVVVKVLPPELARGVDTERFEREIRVAASLQHPHVVPVHSAGQGHGLIYYTMPFVEGESLLQRLEREGALPVSEVMSLLREVTDALCYAHRRGVIHRDLKPANILLEEGHALITDFGIAKALSSAAAEGTQPATLTSTGLIPGTPAYMAPEQAAGDPIDHRTDLYALGCLAYELLAGQPPFMAASAQALMAAHIADDPEPVANRRAGVPSALSALVMRLLAKRAAERPQSADEVLRALEDARGSAQPVSVQNPQRSWLRRRLPAGVVTLAVGFLLGLGVLFAWRRSHPDMEASGVARVAVLPFENLGSPEDEYFADGITDEVRGKLAGLPRLQVIARSSSSQYKNTDKGAQQIGRELGVEYLLTGTIRWVKDVGGRSRVRVSPELVRVATSSTKWQQPFEAPLTDVFEVQADIAARVAQALGIALGRADREQLAGRPTQNLEAYDAFLRGEKVGPALSTIDPIAVRRAITYYERAVALDSTFALAWAQLSRAYSHIYAYDHPSPEGASAAHMAAQRALTLEPGRPDGLLALGDYYSSVLADHARALEQYDHGRRLAPKDARLLTGAASSEMSLGRWRVAVEHLRAAEVLDPRSIDTMWRLSVGFVCLRRYPEALAAAERAMVVGPGNLTAIELRVIVELAQGHLDGAQGVLRAVSGKVDPTELVTFFAAYQDLYWVLDDLQQQLLLRLTPAAFGDNRGSWGLALAQTHALRGNLARAHAYGDSARVALEAQLRDAPEHPQLHALLGLALGYMGKRAEAIREGKRGVSITPISKDALFGAYNEHQLVRIYLLAGDPEKALDHLQRLLQLPYFLSPDWLKIDPSFDPLRDNPRFQRLVRRRSPS